ncbi:hypothetical protein ACFLQ0_05480, partial [Nitrospinota bacterium]
FMPNAVRKPIRAVSRINYGKTRKRWKETIKNNNDALKILLESCFRVLNPIVLTERGRLRIELIPK